MAVGAQISHFRRNSTPLQPTAEAYVGPTRRQSSTPSDFKSTDDRVAALAEAVEDLAACVDDLAGSFLPQAFSRIERVVTGGQPRTGAARESNLQGFGGRRASQPDHSEQVLALAAARRQGTNAAVAGIL